MAQKRITVSSYVKNVKTGEALICASVYISNEKRGTITNSYGFYSISVKQSDKRDLMEFGLMTFLLQQNEKYYLQ